jgi:hypothetical protein
MIIDPEVASLLAQEIEATKLTPAQREFLMLRGWTVAEVLSGQANIPAQTWTNDAVELLLMLEAWGR